MENIGRTSKYNIPSGFNAKQTVWLCGKYKRLSREDGDKLESDSIGIQDRIINRYLDKNPDINVFDDYVDDGYTGTNFNRPGMIRLLDDMKRRNINCIIVKDLSRFGRNYHEVGQYIEVVFPLLKLRFISVNDNIDSFKNPASIKNSSVSFKNVMNDEYGRDISNKVRGTLNMKRRKGLYIGSFALYGYMKSPDNHNKLIIDEEAADTIRLIFRLFIDGISLPNICHTLNRMGILNPTAYKISKGFKVPQKQNDTTKGLWCDRTIRRILQNEMYIGNMVQKQNENISYKIQKCRQVDADKRIVVKNTHEPIIDLDTFQKAQEIFKRDTWQAKAEKSIANNTELGSHVLSGYVKCADCGRAMQRRKIVQPYKTYYYFNCTSYRKWKKCTKHKIQVETVEKVVLTVLQKYIAMAVEMESLIAVINQSPARNTTLLRLRKAIEIKESEKAKTRKFLNDLYPDLKNELITKEQYMQFKGENEARFNEIDLALIDLNNQLAKEEEGIDNSNDFISSFKRHRELTALTREVMLELVDTIYIEENGGVRVVFKFQDAFEQAVEYIGVNKVLVSGFESLDIEKKLVV